MLYEYSVLIESFFENKLLKISVVTMSKFFLGKYSF